MRVKKTHGVVFGAEFTNDEKKALKIECNKIVNDLMAKRLSASATEINAAILWSLHKNEHWGPTKLKRFYKDFQKPMKQVIMKYEMSEEDAGFLSIEALKEYGIDIHEWEKEIRDGGIE